MILVLLGTQNNSFFRLLDELENCIAEKFITDEVIVQAGYTHYASQKMKILDFIPIDEFNNLLQEANLIITHGGVGSILTSIRMGKKVIAVPRLKQYNEHVNDHQVQIIESFSSQGYIRGISDVTQLKDALLEIDNFSPKKYENASSNILKIISNYIDNN